MLSRVPIPRHDKLIVTVETRHSVCALDCPDACSLLINVEDGRGSKLRGNPEHPVTRGFLCGKVARYLDREYSTDRLLYPMRRTGPRGSGRFERVSWDQALDEIAARLTSISNEFGPESILPYSYAGTMGYLNGSGMDRRFFHRLGASRLDRTICSSAGGAGLLASVGFRYGTEPEQFRHSKLIIAWGANVLGTNVHLWPFIVEARRNGARFYVIDPHQNRTGKAADRWFPINPGSDAALALGMMHVILRESLYDADYVAKFTEGIAELKAQTDDYTPAHVQQLTGISADDVVMLAREYATTRPAAIRLNYGVQRSERGGLAVRAIACLPALTGSWKDLGGGLQLTTSGAFVINRPALERPDLQLASPLGREARLVNMSQLGHALNNLSDPPVKALFVYNSNPVGVAPNQSAVLRGLNRQDLFSVVIEQMLTDTARYADILLPATTFLEHTDLYMAYGHYYLQLARPVLPAPGETLSNVEIFRRLAARMGLTDPCFRDTDDDMIRQVLDSASPFVNGITLEELDRKHFIRLRVADEGQPFLPFAEGAFGTPDRKFHFNGGELQYSPPVESRLGDKTLRAKFPLELISPKNDDSMNSTFGNRDDVDRQTAVATLHPTDAGERNIRSGDQVRLYNERGTLVFRVHIDETVAPGVVSVPSTRWPSKAADGNSINILTSERLTDIGNGPVFYSCLVEVEKSGD
jgi:anaerobic selenocysteine-containing dehydrogenase